MPSQLHEGLISLFRNQPALAPDLLAQALQADVPEYTEARIDSADLTEIQPTEYRADLVVQLRRDNSVLGIVIATLSAMAHGQGSDTKKAVQIALAAERAVAGLDTERSELYFDLIRSCLSEVARGAFDNMNPKKYEYQSDFARRYFGQGKVAGFAEGKAAEREIVITALSDRFGVLTESTRDRIQNASGEEVLALLHRLFDVGDLNEALGALS